MKHHWNQVQQIHTKRLERRSVGSNMALTVSKYAHKDIRIVQDFISCMEKHNKYPKVTGIVAKYL